jgi:hypothetical protein
MNTLLKLLQKVRTILALGLVNLYRVVVYRVGVKSGLNPVRRLRAEAPQGIFFYEVSGTPIEAEPVTWWETEASLFGHMPFRVSEQPLDWLANPVTGKRGEGVERVWWQIPDFDAAVGDVKLIWELSRFDWVLAFAQRARNGDAESLERLTHWLGDWCIQNPPYCGPNWKCGQEASIRVMHLAMAALMLRQTARPAQGLVDLIRLHLQRIAPTISYSMAQDNNHGTSEAAALFIGGSWLAKLGIREADTWASSGRKWLENRVRRLIVADGCFSQYSVNYHRLMLDTLSMVEVWRRQSGLAEFSRIFQSRAAAAARWMAALVNPVSGDAPNIGANDGARLLQLTGSGYRDFRPSVQLGMALFTGERAYGEHGPWNEQLAWLGVAVPDNVVSSKVGRVFDGGGYAVLKRNRAMAVLRYPRFRFRPSHADALHLDFWLDGENLLRDGGTYSYNTDPEWLTYFPGTASHNTVQFDGRDQMPRLSRFLFGEWLKTESVDELVVKDDETSFGASYRDAYGVRHRRFVRLFDNRMVVRDEVSGFSGQAVLRWRLKPGTWVLDGQLLSDGRYHISVSSSVPIARIALTSGWESRYYLQKTAVPVFEIEVHEPGVLITEYRW